MDRSSVRGTVLTITNKTVETVGHSDDRRYHRVEASVLMKKDPYQP